MRQEKLDIVYTWVDDSLPGFQEERRRLARNRHDFNANRARDNFDLLKYSLRSIERFAPWRGTIHIVTCRPQVPRWLNLAHPDIRLVHHDEIIPADRLPTFNSFVIESYLHCIPTVSPRFVAFCDDMLLLRSSDRRDFETETGRLVYHFSGTLPSARRRISDRISPWNAALINAARMLDREFGPGAHPLLAHHPRIVDRDEMEAVVARWPAEFEHMRRTRFRAHDTVVPYHLMAAFLVHAGRAVAAERTRTRQCMHYVGLENIGLWNRWLLYRAERARPVFLALNDNFGAHPRPAAEAPVRRFLERVLPKPSAFER
ncbi:MAG: hypothetical protein A3H95_06650 [Acidobacteria bacterium RIFCSPLOWO2_02_FULL_64_15]|nr:MAG: hypothetical protein A3H95_06650 [Acidobacteria bacterium RIFCSPLOWO2_02_FULL_64_15]